MQITIRLLRAHFLAAAVLVLAGCAGRQEPLRQELNGCEIESFGRGVFYFHCDDTFGSALAEFRKQHKILAVTSWLSKSETFGYWVMTDY